MLDAQPAAIGSPAICRYPGRPAALLAAAILHIRAPARKEAGCAEAG